MHTNPQAYVRAFTMEEAVRALENASAFPLSGGALALGMLDVPYEVIVDVQNVPDLNKIIKTPEGVSIGGAVKLQAVVDFPDVPVAFKRAITRTLPENIRNNTSVMETLLVDRPPMEWTAVLTAYDTTVTFMTPDEEQSQFSLTETTLVAGEPGHNLRYGLITNVFIPDVPEGVAIGSAFISRTPASDPIVNAAVTVYMDTATNTVHAAMAAVGGVKSLPPMDMLSLGELYRQPLTPQNIAQVAEAVTHVVKPMSNYLGSAAYRKAMAGVVVRRALEDAAAQL
ncbi:MAG: FAD binding domain-containing protein [Chloroflexota bacterium]